MYCSQCGSRLQDNIRFCSNCGKALTAQAPIDVITAEQAYAASIMVSTAQIKTPSANHAGFWIRTLAALIDNVLLQAGVMVLLFSLFFSWFAAMPETYSAEEIESIAEGMGLVLGLGIQWLYFTVMEASQWQATIGKKVLGLRVTDLDGQRISFGKANGRYWAKLLSSIILLIGFFMIAFTEKKQGLHDKLANTLVVNNR